MKRALAVLLCLGLVATSHATVSRILSMGKHDAFFMDETSVFRNPANVSVYPNMLMGATGEYRILPEDTITVNPDGSANYSALKRTNRDPRDAFFGAILTYSFRKGEGENTQSPMLSFGAVFNRRDALMKYTVADPELYGVETDLVNLADPVGKVDILLGYALPNGGKIGLGTYLAFQNEKETDRRNSVIKGTAGINWPLGRSIDLEASAGVALVNVCDTALVNAVLTDGPDTIAVWNQGDSIILADNDVAVEADVRLFSAMSAINGSFVPHVGVKYAQLKQGQRMLLDVNAGVGLNVNIDKGFFWAGLEGVYKQRDKDDEDYTSSAIGARVSFGIERNVVWDWFVVRVGGMKEILYVTENANDGHWEQNAEHDADDDLVGFGIGLNVENRLKFDILVAEDVVHTLTNLFSGPQHHVFTRIDATFSF